MLQLERITRTFGSHTAVHEVSLSIPAGQMVGVIGRSGAGKSTLLRLVNRLIEPSAGRIVADGVEIGTLAGARLRRWRRECAMIFQQFNLVPRLDVLTNVMLGRLERRSLGENLLGRFSRDERLEALEALDRLGIAATATQLAGTLSGGQQQRVAIARALVQGPSLVLADEPIASLDPLNARRVMDALERINRDDGLTVVVNLHALDVARDRCERIVGMSEGRVVFDGTPDALDDAAVRRIYGDGLLAESVEAVEPAEAAEPYPAAHAVAKASDLDARATVREGARDAHARRREASPARARDTARPAAASAP